MTALLGAVLALAAPAGAAEGPLFGAGSSLHAGSAGYWRFAVSGDARWSAPPWEPYAWTELGFARDADGLSLGGGSWRSLGPGWRARAGLAWSAGRLRGVDERLHAVTLDGGVERRVREAALGAGYALTTGALGGSRSAAEDARGRRGRAARVAASESFTDHAFEATAQVPGAAGVWELRASWEALEDRPDVLSLGAGLRRTLADGLWATPSIRVEAGDATAVVAGVSVYRLF